MFGLLEILFSIRQNDKINSAKLYSVTNLGLTSYEFRSLYIEPQFCLRKVENYKEIKIIVAIHCSFFFLLLALLSIIFTKITRKTRIVKFCLCVSAYCANPNVNYLCNDQSMRQCLVYVE